MAEAKKKPIYESQESLYRKAMAKLDQDPLIVQDSYRTDNYRLAAKMFAEVGDYLDAQERAQECEKKAVQSKADEIEHKYQTALLRLKDAKDEDLWVKMEKSFAELGDYKDSREYHKKCEDKLKGYARASVRHRGIFLGVTAAVLVGVVAGFTTGFFRYSLAYAYEKAGMYRQAQTIFEGLDGLMGSESHIDFNRIARLKTAKKNDIVELGGYDWKVMKKDGNVLHVIAANIKSGDDFYEVSFNEKDGSVTWEDSSLRAWLNGEILEHFTEEERSLLLAQTSTASANEAYGTSYDEETEDYLTILSAEECDTYMSTLKTLSKNYWLRTPGNSDDTVAYMTQSPEIIEYGVPATETLMVRPVMMVDLDSLTEEE